VASLILGIMGKKRSGKDTFAARLVAEHGFTRIGFADALKDVALELDPIVDVIELGRERGVEEVRLSDVLGPELDWEVAKELPEVRRILQALGVAVRNHVGEDVWVRAAMAKADAVPGPVVITDVRFPNEADFIRHSGGQLVRITRHGLEAADEHISETALDGRAADFLVTNNGTVGALHSKADVVARLSSGDM